MPSYADISHAIDNNVDLSTLSQTDQQEWEKDIVTQIDAMRTHPEELAIGQQHLILFQLRTIKSPDTEKISAIFQSAKNNFIVAEQQIRENKGNNPESETQESNQLDIFYKMTEFRYAALENEFTKKQLLALASQAKSEKLRLLQKQELLEGNYAKYLELGRINIISILRKHIFVYAFLSAIGIVLLWQGVWGAIDWTIALLGLEDYLFPYLITMSMGALILYSLGLFVSLTAGVETTESADPNNLEDLEKINTIMKERSSKKMVQ